MMAGWWQVISGTEAFSVPQVNTPKVPVCVLSA